MITNRKDLSINQNYLWVDVRDMDKDDIAILTDEYMLSSELLADIMDVDEQARIEKEDDYTIIICRVPVDSEDEDEEPLERRSIPLGIVLYPDKVITICRGDSVVIDDFARHRFRQCPVDTKEGFVISILGRSALVYTRLLKYINRQKDLVEEQLNKAIMNYELLQLLTIQKSLVFLTTSVTSNQMLLERLQKTPYFKLNNEEEVEFLEDTIIDNKQAIEMANIYSGILSGTMDAFASVISNNQNLVMKTLAAITIVMSIPNIIAGLYGMNVAGIPFADNPMSFALVCIFTLAIVLIATFILKKKDMF